MKKFIVTKAGRANVSKHVLLNEGEVVVTQGGGGFAWTLDATFRGQAPVDDEGWSPWDASFDCILMTGWLEIVNDST